MADTKISRNSLAQALMIAQTQFANDTARVREAAPRLAAQFDKLSAEALRIIDAPDGDDPITLID